MISTQFGVIVYQIIISRCTLMSVSYEYYKIFYYVAKYKSFNKAAAVLSNSQPNISRTINNLEYELGCRLFNRSHNGVTLTEAGQELYSHVEIAWRHLQIGEAVTRSSNDLRHGSLIIGLSIGITSYVVNHMILPVIKMYHETYPNIDLHLINHDTPSLIRNHRDGLLDIAIITAPLDDGNKDDNTILYSYSDILVAGQAFAFLKDKTLSLKEVTQYPLISLIRSTETYQLYNSFFAAHGLQFNPKIEAAHTLQMLSFVTENLGVGFTDSTSCEKDLAEGRVLKINLQEELPRRYVAMADNNKELTPAASMFKKILLESLKQ